MCKISRFVYKNLLLIFAVSICSHLSAQTSLPQNNPLTDEVFAICDKVQSESRFAGNFPSDSAASLPASVTIFNNNPFATVIVSADTGAVDITMEVHFGACIMYLTKHIQFNKADTLAPSPNGNGIEAITVFPNPNSGQFSVEVKLYKKQTFAIYVYNSQGIEQSRIIIPVSDYSLNTISIPNSTPGTYLLKVIAEYDSKSKTIVVTQ